MKRWRAVDDLRSLLAPLSAGEMRRLLEERPQPWRRGERSEVHLKRCDNCREWLTERSVWDGQCRACGALIQ